MFVEENRSNEETIEWMMCISVRGKQQTRTTVLRIILKV